MATLKIFNRLLFRPNLCAAFRKNISTVKRGRSFLSFNNHTSSFKSKNTGLLSTSLSFSRVCGCGMHNSISEGILLSIVLFKCAEHLQCYSFIIFSGFCHVSLISIETRGRYISTLHNKTPRT